MSSRYFYVLSAPLATLLATTGCDLIKINGKTLGGPTAAPVDPGATAGPPTSPTPHGTARGAASPAAPSTATQADREAWKQAVQAGNEANSKLFDAVKADTIPQQWLTKLADARDRARALGNEGSADFFDTRYSTYRIIQGMLALDDGDQTVLSEALEGRVEDNGVLPNKNAKLSFKVERGRCYTVALKWRRPTGTESERDYAWTATKPDAIQRYRGARSHGYLPHYYGVCATADTQLTLTMEHEASGSKPRLQYAVVSWDKAEFPLSEILYAGVHWSDACSSASWKRLWLDPIPGSITFMDDEPFLITSTATGGQLVMHNVSGSQRGTSIGALRDAPEGPIRFSSQFSMPRCSSAVQTETGRSRAAARCHEAVDRKYDKLFKAADRQAEAARSVATLETAERKLASLRASEGNARKTKCGKADRALREDMERTFNEIVDHYSGGTPPPSMGRAARLGRER